MSEQPTHSQPETPDRVLRSRTLNDAELLAGGADYDHGVLKPTADQVEALRRENDPDRHLASRTISDAALLHGGAKYENKVLKVTPEQIAQLRNINTATARLGSAGLEKAGLVLFTIELSDLSYLNSEEAVENKSRLQAELRDIVGRYEDAIRPYFPTDIKRFSDAADNYVEATKNESGQSIRYIMQFHSAKVRNQEGRKVTVPNYAEISREKYGRYRDRAYYYTDPEGTLSTIKLTTAVDKDIRYIHTADQIADDHAGLYRKGIANDIVSMIDRAALPVTKIYDRGRRLDVNYEARIVLHDSKYALEVQRLVQRIETNGRISAHDGQSVEKLVYVYDPSSDRFAKSTASNWDAGPADIDKSVFVEAVKRGLEHIPTVKM